MVILKKATLLRAKQSIKATATLYFSNSFVIRSLGVHDLDGYFDQRGLSKTQFYTKISSFRGGKTGTTVNPQRGVNYLGYSLPGIRQKMF